MDFPPGRGLFRPSEIMPEARSLIVMGMVIWDEGMNAAISIPGTGDFSGGEAEYYNSIMKLLKQEPGDLLNGSGKVRVSKQCLHMPCM